MKVIKTFQGTIYPWNCDHMGHMNVRFYGEKFDEAGWNLFAYLGLTAEYFKKNNCGMVALEQHIKYHSELLPGDTIYIESSVVELKEKIVILRQVMFNAISKKMAAETTVTILCIDTKRRKAIPLPDFVQKNSLKLFEK